MFDSEDEAAGTVVNTFQELEPEYLREYIKARGKKVWCIGPVSLCNVDDSDRAERGNTAAIDGHDCLKWLDSHESDSVIYACLGSISRLSDAQLMELGVGLEASNRPFVWVRRNASAELESWLLEEKFEERVGGRGLLIRGWAPQVLILSHPSVGGFITHCGWNSTLEGVSAGMPIEVVMQRGEEGRERRRRAREVQQKAKIAIQEGGSSCLSLTLLIEDIKAINPRVQDLTRIDECLRDQEVIKILNKKSFLVLDNVCISVTCCA